MLYSYLRFKFGAVLHVLAKWFQWKSVDKSRKWMGYWKSYLPLVGLGMILNFFFWILWYNGLVDGMVIAIINFFIKTTASIAGSEPTNLITALPKNALMDISAGFMIDSIAKNIFAKWLNKLGLL